MTGLDTNVLLAWLLSGQKKPILGETRYRISDIVLAELIWLLRSSFRNSRDEITRVIAVLLETGNFDFRDRIAVEAALADFRAYPADFPDFLLMRDNAAAGCETTLTLDKKAARHPGFRLVKG